MRVHVKGDAALRNGLTALLEDPRVGYSVGSLAHCALTLLPGNGRPRVVGDLDNSLVRHVMVCVRELAGDVTWAGPGDLAVEVPPATEDETLRGVLRGLMRYGKHGLKRWWKS